MLVTLGCFRNEVEADNLRTALFRMGMGEASAAESADIILVLTCGFIREACDEGIDTLLRVDEIACALSRRPPVLALGCMTQRYGPELMEEMPEIDGILGVDWLPRLEEAVVALLRGGRYETPPGSPAISHVERRVDSETGPSLYVRASEGCDRACSFCAIPVIRGPHRSRPPSEILDEIQSLGGRPREVVLLAQDLASYGSDLGTGEDLADLLGRIARLDAAHWIRMLYLQPEGVTERLIEAVAAEPGVCDYFDLPFQHASSRILGAMGRPGSAREHLRLIDRIRRTIPGAAIRSTVIVGYPGETDADFRDLVEFVQEARFDWLGAFMFSPEEGTRAAGQAPAVPNEIALSRYNTVIDLQNEIEARKTEAIMGRELEVAVEGACDLEPYDFVGRSYREAPVVDGVIYLKRAGGPGPMRPGDFASAVISGREGLDLVGEISDSQA